MVISSERIQRLDASGYNVVDALTTAGLGVSPTASKPNAFVCVDGATYWVKASVQQGLAAELIAGRLAERVGAGPPVRLVRVTPEARPADGSTDHLDGVLFGSSHQQNVVNARDLAPLMAGGQFQAGAVDPLSRGRAIVFQTWLGVSDAQVLVRLTDGAVSSIDHGDCFGNVSDTSTPPSVVVTDIPGIGADVGREAAHVLPAVDRIESVTDDELIAAVCQIPSGDAWQSPSDRRLAIAEWLAARRQLLGSVMRGWMLP